MTFVALPKLPVCRRFKLTKCTKRPPYYVPLVRHISSIATNIEPGVKMDSDTLKMLIQSKNETDVTPKTPLPMDASNSLSDKTQYLTDTQRIIQNIERQSSTELVQYTETLQAKQSCIAQWQAISSRFQELLPVLSPGEISSVIWSFSLKRLRDEKLIYNMLRHISPILQTFATDELVKCVSALGRLQVRDSQFFIVASRQVAIRAATMSGRQLGEVMLTYANLRYFHLPLHNVLRTNIVERGRLLTARDITLMLQALKMLGLKDDHFFTILVRHTHRVLATFKENELAVIISAYAKFKVRNTLCLTVLEQALFPMRNVFSPKSIGIILNSASQLQRIKCDELVLYFADKMLTEYKYYYIDSLCLAVSGLARLAQRIKPLKIRITPLFHSIGERLGQLSLNLTPSIVTHLVYAYAKMDIQYGPLFYHAPIHIERYINDYLPDQLALILKSYAILDLNHGPLIEIILSHLPRFEITEEQYQLKTSYSDIDMNENINSQIALPIKSKKKTNFLSNPLENHPKQVQTSMINAPHVISLLWIFEILAQWNIYDNHALTILINQLTLRARELDVKTCINALTALAAFQIKNDSLIKALTQQITIAWDAYTQYKLNLNKKTKKRKICRSRRSEQNQASNQEFSEPIQSFLNNEKKPKKLLKSKNDDILKKKLKTPVNRAQTTLLIEALNRLDIKAQKFLPKELFQLRRRVKKTDVTMNKKNTIYSTHITQPSEIDIISKGKSVLTLIEDNKEYYDMFQNLLQTASCQENTPSWKKENKRPINQGNLTEKKQKKIVSTPARQNLRHWNFTANNESIVLNNESMLTTKKYNTIKSIPGPSIQHTKKVHIEKKKKQNKNKTNALNNVSCRLKQASPM